MYEETCLYCGKDYTFWECDGFINCYVPVWCEHCDKLQYYLHRSWFDPFYDNHNVEFRKPSWIKKKLKDLDKVGAYDDRETHKAFVYRPKWDIYEPFGGREKAMEVIKEIWERKAPEGEKEDE